MPIGDIGYVYKHIDVSLVMQHIDLCVEFVATQDHYAGRRGA